MLYLRRMLSPGHTIRVSSIRRETPDSVSVEFDIPHHLQKTFAFQAGQYLTLQAKINGEDVRRSYSLCSAPFENKWRIAVKEVPGGLFSQFVNRQLQVGMAVTLFPPEGRFVVPAHDGSPKFYAFFAAGSGITPIISIIKTVLHTEPQSQCLLIYGNQSVEQTLFLEELFALKNKFIDRLQLHFLLSREEIEEELFFGRISREKIKHFENYLFSISDVNEIFICGPEEMIVDLRSYFLERGILPKRVHLELFGISVKRERKHMAHSPGYAKVTMTIDGKTIDFGLAFDGPSILDEALKYSKGLPFACKGGVCCTCKAKLIRGEVEMEVNYGLEPEEVEQGYILTCQSHPKTEEIVIDFDH